MEYVLIGLAVLTLAGVAAVLLSHNKLHDKINQLLGKTPAVNEPPVPATAAPVAPTPAPAAAVAPAAPVADAVKPVALPVTPPVAPAPAPVNPFVAWFQQGKTMEWCILQGLGGVAPSDAQWAQAVAAGYVKDSGPQAAPAGPAIDFSAPVLAFEDIRDRDMTFTGPVSKTITGCPATVLVKTGARSGALLKTPYTVTLDGIKSPPQDNPQGGYMMNVAGPSFVVSIDQQPDSIIDLWIG